MRGDIFYHNEKVVFYSDENYQLVGESEITCKDGSWNDLFPICVGTLPSLCHTLIICFFCSYKHAINTHHGFLTISFYFGAFLFDRAAFFEQKKKQKGKKKLALNVFIHQKESFNIMKRKETEHSFFSQSW